MTGSCRNLTVKNLKFTCAPEFASAGRVEAMGDRLLELESEKIAGRVEVGDMVSWHQGSKTDFQCFFGEIDGLTLCNLRTANANGFAMIAFDVHNLTAERVVFKPEGNQLFCAPRDVC